MNNISQISIFDYTEIENLGDLAKLKLFLENVEDGDLCETLEKKEKWKKRLSSKSNVKFNICNENI